VSSTLVPLARVASRIFELRGRRVILDADLAEIYGVTTKRLNEAVKRNQERFPDDFVFQIDLQEAAALRSQFATSNDAAKQGRGGTRYCPFAFTEHGAIMAAAMLNSPQAVQMSLFVVRAFVQMREALAGHQELAKKLTELERKLTERLDEHERAILHLLNEMKQLVEPPEPPRKRIGFGVAESRGVYYVNRKRTGGRV
jgi:phage regulator Rha-like protein